MTLAEYLKDEALSAAEFARSIGKSRAAVTRWINGTRFPDLQSMRAVVAATGGAVTREELRPDLYGPAEAA